MRSYLRRKVKGTEEMDMNETREKCDKISVIVPCYNEEESLGHFYERTALVLAQMDVDYELLFVDDGSSDKTLSILRDMRERDSHCRYVSFSRNFGKEAAMYAGLREADGDYRVFMDADPSASARTSSRDVSGGQRGGIRLLRRKAHGEGTETARCEVSAPACSIRSARL